MTVVTTEAVGPLPAAERSRPAKDSNSPAWVDLQKPKGTDRRGLHMKSFMKTVSLACQMTGYRS